MPEGSATDPRDRQTRTGIRGGPGCPRGRSGLLQVDASDRLWDAMAAGTRDDAEAVMFVPMAALLTRQSYQRPLVSGLMFSAVTATGRPAAVYFRPDSHEPP